MDDLKCVTNYNDFKFFLDELEKRNIQSWDEMDTPQKYIFTRYVLQIKKDVDEALELIHKWEDVCGGVIEDQMTFQ
ncbi:MAG: hypothetical protein APF84_12545 [Gracilibacter sp. BRH_c7a]|nr:MAG: hypothetical protein APF84_12545 [Gracilibacter sp. BRH_c7a]